MSEREIEILNKTGIIISLIGLAVLVFAEILKCYFEITMIPEVIGYSIFILGLLIQVISLVFF